MKLSTGVHVSKSVVGLGVNFVLVPVNSEVMERRSSERAL